MRFGLCLADSTVDEKACGLEQPPLDYNKLDSCSLALESVAVSARRRRMDVARSE